MVKCPDCKKDLSKPTKTWTYGRFAVQAYVCSKCNARFNEYTKAGKHSFTLKYTKKKGYIKA